MKVPHPEIPGVGHKGKNEAPWAFCILKGSARGHVSDLVLGNVRWKRVLWVRPL